jgi:hypothetical protein
MANGFQSQVYYSPAPATEGDFCDTNPRYTVDAGPFGLIAGPAGVRIGYFAWISYRGIDADNAPIEVNSFGSGPVAGFVHREQQGLITTYLANAGMTVPGGFPVTVFAGGGFWAVNNGAAQALPGMKAYADFATGKVTFAATASPTSASFTAGIAPGTFSVTGSINGNILTVTAVGSGAVVAGALISGTGVASGTRVVSQVSGTAGGIGTYAVSIPNQIVASTTISGTYGTLTVSAGTNPPIGAGRFLECLHCQQHADRFRRNFVCRDGECRDEMGCHECRIAWRTSKNQRSTLGLTHILHGEFQ